MIARIWSGESPLWLLLLPLSWCYGLASGIIRLCYRLGIKRAWRAPVPVVVVGNLTAGGNGKTPVVIWLVEQLQRCGIRVGVVSRGYGGKAAHYPLLLTPQTTTGQAGDEPVLIYRRTGAPVAVSPVRADAVKAILAREAVQLIITDDGLQHYRLARDKEIVVIDGVRRFGNGWWLPAGPMRERASRLALVDAIITNGGRARSGEISMRLQPGLAVNLATAQRCEVSRLNNIVAMAGIGHPSRFFTTLQACGAQPLRCVALADHQTLAPERVKALAKPGETMVMTEKDAVKYQDIAEENWWYLPVDAVLDGEKPQQLLRELISLTRPLCCFMPLILQLAGLLAFLTHPGHLLL